jgi:hypothetical protein
MPEALEWARETGTLGGKPLAVVSAADHGTEALTDSEAESTRIEREDQALQEEFTALSSESTRRIVEGSTHESLVLRRDHVRKTGEEILQVVEAVSTGRRLEAVGPRTMNSGAWDATFTQRDDQKGEDDKL